MLAIWGWGFEYPRQLRTVCSRVFYAIDLAAAVPTAGLARIRQVAILVVPYFKGASKCALAQHLLQPVYR